MPLEASWKQKSVQAADHPLWNALADPTQHLSSHTPDHGLRHLFHLSRLGPTLGSRVRVKNDLGKWMFPQLQSKLLYKRLYQLPGMQIRYAKNQFWSITIYNEDKYQSLTMLNFDQWLEIFHSKGHIASISQCKKLPFALIFKLLIFEVWNLTSKSGKTGSTSTGVTPGLL